MIISNRICADLRIDPGESWGGELPPFAPPPPPRGNCLAPLLRWRRHWSLHQWLFQTHDLQHCTDGIRLDATSSTRMFDANMVWYSLHVSVLAVVINRHLMEPNISLNWKITLADCSSNVGSSGW